MKKLLLISALMVSGGAWASSNCDKIASIAQANASNYGDTKTIALIDGKKGTKAYFHSAPLNQCKLNPFIIPGDRVQVLQDIYSNGESWAFVVFIRSDTQTITQGWIKKSHLGEMTFS